MNDTVVEVTGKNVQAEADASIVASQNALAVAANNTSPEDQNKIKSLVSSIDINDTSSIINYGREAQSGLSDQTSAMLAGVRNKDVGPVGDVMNGLMVEIRGLGLNDLDPNAENGFLAKLMRKVTPLQKFIQKYESIESQVDSMVAELENHEKVLGRDVVMLDGMYDESMKFFNNLALYIEAAELKLAMVRSTDIPAATAAMEAAEGNDAMRLTQELQDLSSRVLDLERKIDDLGLTRVATMQMLPQLRMIQDVDKGLVNKIHSCVVSTIPLWKGQIAMSMTIWNATKAAASTKAIGDATSEMLIANAQHLKGANAAARTEMERGIVDMDALKTVNALLIETIQETADIVDMGKQARLSKKADMITMEINLKDALKGAAQRAIAA
jgi:uncharacterized protein YaaN involved in tellurite resistance